jgi:hypothetical protein
MSDRAWVADQAVFGRFTADAYCAPVVRMFFAIQHQASINLYQKVFSTFCMFQRYAGTAEGGVSCTNDQSGDSSSKQRSAKKQCQVSAAARTMISMPKSTFQCLYTADVLRRLSTNPRRIHSCKSRAVIAVLFSKAILSNTAARLINCCGCFVYCYAAGRGLWRAADQGLLPEE